MLIPITACQLRRFISITILLFLSFYGNAQIGIGINPPDASAMLHVQDTARGMLIPRMTAAQKTAINNPAEGLMIYQTNESTGFWYFTHGAWTAVSNGGKNAIVLRGDISNSEAQAKITAEAGPSTQIIKIIDCNNITNLDLSMVSGGLTQLWLQNNVQLQNITLGNITTIEDTFLISNCPQLTSINLPQLKKLNSQLRLVNTGLTSLSLPLLDRITGSIVITGNSNLTAVSMPLVTNATTGYSLLIQNNNKLTSVDMRSLVKAISFTISNNRKLNTINFNSLSSTTYGLDIVSDSSLTSISFPVLTSVGANNDIEIAGDSSLVSLSLPLLTSATSLYIANLNLQTITFTSLSSLAYDLTIYSSAASTISFPALTSVSSINIAYHPLLTSVNLPVLASVQSPVPIYQGGIYSNPLLTAINWPNLNSISMIENAHFNSNRLPSSEVNEILAKLVAGGMGNGTIDVRQTPAAPPTGQGITDKATLLSRNNVVNTN
ncbi:MAG: hypothetical protein V4685_04750 [Bacteroidota bacterium]